MGLRRYSDAKSILAGLQPEFGLRLERYLTAAHAAGHKITIYSAYRTQSRQAELKRQYGAMAATSGFSPHQFGVACDITVRKNDYTSARALWAHGNAPKYGLKFGLLPRSSPFYAANRSRANNIHESWHIEHIDWPGAHASGRARIGTIDISVPVLDRYAAAGGDYRTDCQWISASGPVGTLGAAFSGSPAPLSGAQQLQGGAPSAAGLKTQFEKDVIPPLYSILTGRGIPASAVPAFIAQVAIETGYGSSTNYRTRRNIAGIRGAKVTSSNTRGYVSYSTYAAGLEAYVNLLFAPRYANVIAAAKTGDPFAVCIALGVSPWATGHYRYGVAGDEDRAGDAGVFLGQRGTDGFVLRDVVKKYPHWSLGGFGDYTPILMNEGDTPLYDPFGLATSLQTSRSNLLARRSELPMLESDDQLIQRVFGVSRAQLRTFGSGRVPA